MVISRPEFSSNFLDRIPGAVAHWFAFFVLKIQFYSDKWFSIVSPSQPEWSVRIEWTSHGRPSEFIRVYIVALYVQGCICIIILFWRIFGKCMCMHFQYPVSALCYWIIATLATSVCKERFPIENFTVAIKDPIVIPCGTFATLKAYSTLLYWMKPIEYKYTR